MTMDGSDYIEIVKTKSLPRATRLNALNEILSCPAPGRLKRLLDDEKVLRTITLEIHEKGAASSLFWIIYKSFGLNEDD